MGRQHVGHDEIAAFAQDKVNLPKDKADEYRAQARRLREKLEGYLSEHLEHRTVRLNRGDSGGDGNVIHFRLEVICDAEALFA